MRTFFARPQSEGGTACRRIAFDRRPWRRSNMAPHLGSDPATARRYV